MLQLHRIDRLLPALFFAALLLIGIFIYKDYGIAWDEPQQRRLGLATWDYVTGTNDDLLHTDNLYHNPFTELLAVLPEKIFHPDGERAIYKSRHLFNFIFCWVGLIFFYLLALRIFRDYHYAILSCILFLLTPRLFAHCFYNSKDLPFLFLFVTSIFCLLSWLQHPSWKNMLWMALSSGAATGGRILGIMIPVLALLAFLISVGQRKMGWKEGKMMAAYLLLYPVLAYIFFPTIWQNPATGFYEVLKFMSHFASDVATYFMGVTTHSLNTPWYYIPVWMGIIIPLGWWLFFITGMIALLVTIIKKRSVFVSVNWLIIIVWLMLPPIVIIVLHSSVYDDGRHLFFTYPPFLLIAVYGIRSLLQKSISGSKFFQLFVPAGAVSVFLITTIYVMVFMIRFHPYQYVFFNAIGRKYAADYFEKDYWGLSYRSALEWLVKSDRSDQINVCWKVDPCEWNLAWLNNYDRQRIHQVHYDHCDYYITNYRTHHPADASDEKIYEVNVQAFTIVAVYKMHPPNATPTSLP
ncbi:MAG TPA: glycosyltransferase family 39 protein [Chitinophagales bacterium]|nr:glycosyltransferase family 39 protein [Chitinophagales bacterium]